MKSAAIVITTYNWPEALNLVLSSASIQRVMPNEIHIADDGSTGETAELIKFWSKRLPFPVSHHWQEDDGFRPNPVRNEAIANCSSDLVITLDGDMIMHPDLVSDHLEFSKPGYFIQSRRVRLSESLTASALEHGKFEFSIMTKGVRRRTQAIRNVLLARLTSTGDQSFRHIRGANMSICRKDLIAVNGLNEDFVGWGFEDHELIARLYHSGLKRTYLRQAALAYHLEHADNDRHRKSFNQGIFEQCVSERLERASNGLAENHTILHSLPATGI
jgi:glycosyltransferase involved in cell wall biosynthesis